MTKCIHVPGFLTVLICSVVLVGCEGRDDISDLEAVDGEVLSSVRSGLAKVKRDLTDLSDELQAARGIQEELMKQIEMLVADRDNAEVTAKVTEQRIEELAAQINEQVEVLSQFENEVKGLNVAVENQQTTINELQTTITELVNIIEQQAAAEEQQEEVVEYQEQEEEH